MLTQLQKKPGELVGLGTFFDDSLALVVHIYEIFIQNLIGKMIWWKPEKLDRNIFRGQESIKRNAVAYLILDGKVITTSTSGETIAARIDFIVLHGEEKIILSIYPQDFHRKWMMQKQFEEYISDDKRLEEYW